MSFKLIQDLKKKNDRNYNYEEVDLLICGLGIFTQELIKVLKQTDARFKILNSHNIKEESLAPWTWGPSQIRGKENIFFLQNLLQDKLVARQVKNSPLFYKDQKFYQFDGRARPETLLPGEQFFSQIDSAEIVSQFNNGETNGASFENIVFENCLIEKISRVVPDLLSHPNLEKDFNFEVKTSLGRIYLCKKIIWQYPVSHFLKVYDGVTDIDVKLIEEFDKFNDMTTLSVRFILKNQLSEFSLDQTCFLPLSFTHEMGHFIGAQHRVRTPLKSTFDHDVVCFDFLHYFDSTLTSEEEIAKKIRTLKKTLSKISSTFDKNLEKEFFCVGRIEFGGEINDLIFEGEASKFSDIHFVGMLAPIPTCIYEKFGMNEMKGKITHMARAIASFESIKNIFIQ